MRKILAPPHYQPLFSFPDVHVRRQTARDGIPKTNYIIHMRSRCPYIQNAMYLRGTKKFLSPPFLLLAHSEDFTPQNSSVSRVFTTTSSHEPPLTHTWQ